jgi:hypothetical protein
MAPVLSIQEASDINVTAYLLWNVLRGYPGQQPSTAPS